MIRRTRGRPPVRSNRRGISLIEMMVVISCASILLGLCAVSIQTLWRAAGDGQARRSAAAGLNRLAEQFREDVHAASPLGDSDLSERKLRLALENGITVAYEAKAGRVERVESAAGGKVTRRESYVIGRDRSARFEQRDDGPRRFLALVVRHESRKGRTEPPRPIEILALPGKDRIEAVARPKGGPTR